MKLNHIWDSVRSRLGLPDTTSDLDSDATGSTGDKPPRADMIDTICDFLSFRFDQHLDRWQVIAALALAVTIILVSLAGVVRARLASGVTVTARAAPSGTAAGEGKGATSRKGGTAGSTGTDKQAPYAYVYVCGAVKQPGVYRASTGSRVNAAIALAGGLASNADATRINLARRVVDGERVYVPRAGETLTPALLDNGLGGSGVSASSIDGAAGSGATTNGYSGDAAGSGATGQDGSGASDPNTGRGPAWRSDGRLNLNLATAADLDTLPGIGPAYAARILDYRQQHNGFTDAGQLGNVRGIGPKTLAKLKPLVYVE